MKMRSHVKRARLVIYITTHPGRNWDLGVEELITDNDQLAKRRTKARTGVPQIQLTIFEGVTVVLVNAVN